MLLLVLSLNLNSYGVYGTDDRSSLSRRGESGLLNLLYVFGECMLKGYRRPLVRHMAVVIESRGGRDDQCWYNSYQLDGTEQASLSCYALQQKFQCPWLEREWVHGADCQAPVNIVSRT